MGIGINIDHENGPSRRKDLLNLLEYEKVGSTLTYHGEYGFTWLSLSFVKMNKTKLCGYSHTRYSWGTPQVSSNLMIITKRQLINYKAKEIFGKYHHNHMKIK